MSDARSAHAAAADGGCVSSCRTCGCRSSERAVRARARMCVRSGGLVEQAAALQSDARSDSSIVTREVRMSPLWAAAACRAAACAAAERASAQCAREHAAPSGEQPQTVQLSPLAADSLRERVALFEVCTSPRRAVVRCRAAARAAADRASALCAREHAAPSGGQPQTRSAYRLLRNVSVMPAVAALAAVSSAEPAPHMRRPTERSRGARASPPRRAASSL